jgi:hypothetical protein
MRKILILLMAVAFLPLMGHSIGAYKTGDELYVWAISGLNLREKPAQESAKLTNIPLGNKVKVLGTALKKIAFQVSEAGGYTIKGYWVEIQYGNQRGFAFDGFLSKIVPPTKEEKYLPTEYFNRIFKVKSTSKTPPKGTVCLPGTYDYSLYTNNVSTQFYQHEAGGVTENTLPNTLLTFEEVYLLGKMLYQEDPSTYKTVYKASPQSITITSKDELNQIDIVKKTNFIALSFSIAD